MKKAIFIFLALSMSNIAFAKAGKSWSCRPKPGFKGQFEIDYAGPGTRITRDGKPVFYDLGSVAETPNGKQIFYSTDGFGFLKIDVSPDERTGTMVYSIEEDTEYYQGTCVQKSATSQNSNFDGKQANNNSSNKGRIVSTELKSVTSYQAQTIASANGMKAVVVTLNLEVCAPSDATVSYQKNVIRATNEYVLGGIRIVRENGYSLFYKRPWYTFIFNEKSISDPSNCESKNLTITETLYVQPGKGGDALNLKFKNHKIALEAFDQYPNDPYVSVLIDPQL